VRRRGGKLTGQRGVDSARGGRIRPRGSGSGQSVAQGEEHVALKPDLPVPIPAAAPGLLVPRRLPRDRLERHGDVVVLALLARGGGFGQRRADLARCMGLVAAALGTR
jgi:hypothetical protein